MQTTQQHGGFAISQRTDGGGLAKKIEAAQTKLLAVPLAKRDEYWAAAVGGVIHAAHLLAGGRRAKAGKVLANAKELINYAS